MEGSPDIQPEQAQKCSCHTAARTGNAEKQPEGTAVGEEEHEQEETQKESANIFFLFWSKRKSQHRKYYSTKLLPENKFSKSNFPCISGRISL